MLLRATLLTCCFLLIGFAPSIARAQTADPPKSIDQPTGAGSAATTGESGEAEKAQPSPAEQAEQPGQPAGDQEAPAEEDDGEQKSSEEDEKAGFFESGAIGLLLQGGFFMWPILLMGVLAMGVILERYRSLKMVSADSGNIRGRVQRLLQEERIEEALRLCDEEQGPVAAVLSSGLRKYYVLKRLNYDPSRIDEQVVKAMEDYSVHIVAALERNLAVLATVSSAAPMLGFLGTVQGMIVAFQDIVAKMGETNIVAAAAAGIQVSLLTTCFGLIVGIPAYIAFNYFTSVINRFALDVEESATELVESVTLQMAVSKQDSDLQEIR